MFECKNRWNNEATHNREKWSLFWRKDFIFYFSCYSHCNYELAKRIVKHVFRYGCFYFFRTNEIEIKSWNKSKTSSNITLADNEANTVSWLYTSMFYLFFFFWCLTIDAWKTIDGRFRNFLKENIKSELFICGYSNLNHFKMVESMTTFRPFRSRLKAIWYKMMREWKIIFESIHW